MSTTDNLLRVLADEVKAAREGVASEMQSFRAEIGAQLDGIRSEVHDLAARLGPVEEQLARQAKAAELAEAERRGAQQLAERMGWEEGAVTEAGPLPPPRWKRHAQEALDLVGSRGGLALLLAVLSGWLGPEVVGQIMSIDPVAEPPPAYIPSGRPGAPVPAP